MNTKVILSKRLADYLIENGNTLLYTLNNKFKPGYSVFVFLLTDKLLEDMTEYTNNKK